MNPDPTAAGRFDLNKSGPAKVGWLAKVANSKTTVDGGATPRSQLLSMSGVTVEVGVVPRAEVRDNEMLSAVATVLNQEAAVTQTPFVVDGFQN
jgi:hypothetical protein